MSQQERDGAIGSAEADLMSQRLTAQIQSLNHRYCEISVRLPRSLSQFENPVRAS